MSVRIVILDQLSMIMISYGLPIKFTNIKLAILTLLTLSHLNKNEKKNITIRPTHVKSELFITIEKLAELNPQFLFYYLDLLER